MVVATAVAVVATADATVIMAIVPEAMVIVMIAKDGVIIECFQLLLPGSRWPSWLSRWCLAKMIEQ